MNKIELEKYLNSIFQYKNISDETLQLITGQIFVSQAILVAYKLGLFKQLSREPQSIDDLSDTMPLEKRAIQTMLSCACSMNLVEHNNDCLYQLSLLGNIFLNDSNPSYYGAVLDLLIEQNSLMNFPCIEQSILANSPQIDGGNDIFSDTSGLANSIPFVRAIHQKAFLPAFYWARQQDLDEYRNFVDIGGGSGIHTIAACFYNKSLNGTVCDRKAMLPHIDEYINKFSFNKRIKSKKLDMWHDSFPQGDVYFLGDIFHDWAENKCRFLAKKCFDALPEGGLILVHEMLFNEKKEGPFLSSAYNAKMQLWTEGQQFSGSEIKKILIDSGFKDVQFRKSLGNWTIIQGKK